MSPAVYIITNVDPDASIDVEEHEETQQSFHNGVVVWDRDSLLHIVILHLVDQVVNLVEAAEYLAQSKHFEIV